MMLEMRNIFIQEMVETFLANGVISLSILILIRSRIRMMTKLSYPNESGLKLVWGKGLPP